MAIRRDSRASRSSRSSRRKQGGWFLAGYAGIAGFLALEALTRQPGAAASLETSAGDQGTTRLIVIAYGLAAELPLVLRRVPAPELPPAAAPIGLAVQAAGLGLRAWTGFALTSRSVPVLVLVAGLLGRAYQRRIAAEEQLLRRDLPGYAAYSERTRRLIPFVW